MVLSRCAMIRHEHPRRLIFESMICSVMGSKALVASSSMSMGGCQIRLHTISRRWGVVHR